VNDKVVLIGALGAAGLGAWYLITRTQAADASSTSGADAASAGYGPDTGLGGGFGPGGAFDPFLPNGPGAGLPGSPGAPGGSPLLPPGPAGDTPVAVHLSPDTEAALLRQNQALNDQADATNRFSQAIQASVATAAAVPFAIGGAVKLGRALASPLQGAGRAASGAVESVAARLAPGATGIGDVGAVTWTGAAAGVGAGLALGVAGVAALKQTGALGAVQRFGANVVQKQNAGILRVERTALLPLTTLGALATGLVGFGNVTNNARAALRGTFLGDWLHA
jgi:hypothetical protein